MRTRFGMLIGLLAVAAFATTAAAQDPPACTEACYHYCPNGYPCAGWACIHGWQGWDCAAGTYYCMINECVQDPETLVSPDGRRFYAMVPCDGGTPLVVSRVVIELESVDVSLTATDEATVQSADASPAPPPRPTGPSST